MMPMLPGHIDDPEQAVVVVLGCVDQLSFFFWQCTDHGLWFPLFDVKVRGNSMGLSDVVVG